MVNIAYKGIDFENEKNNNFFKSMVAFMQDNYHTIQSSNSRSSPVVFCIHGNKWGVANCCEELEGQSHAEHEPMLGYQSDGKSGTQDTLHCHTSREEGIDKKARRKLILASILCLVFMIGEVIGGVLSNSLAIATDAAHLLTDFASFMISLLAIWLAARPKSQKMSFGWHRAEVMGAIISVLMIWVVTGVLVYMAIQRLITKEYEINAEAMLITSGLGVVVNIIMGAGLHQHGHSHGGGHGHSHNTHAEDGNGSHAHAHAQEKENINVKAAFIHVVGDFLQSLGVFTAALVIYFKPEWTFIDPICTFAFSILVLATTVSILRNTVGVLMEATPSGISHNIVKNTFLNVEGIKQVHNLRIWSLTTDKTALGAHLVIDTGSNAQKILRDATQKIREKYDLYEMTLQVEEFENDMMACDQCKDPSK